MPEFEYKEIELSNKTRWVVAKALIDFESDLYKRAVDQAKKKAAHTMNASQSGAARTQDQKMQKQLMGTVAEIYSQVYLQEILEANGLEKDWLIIRYDDVRTDEFKSPANEYDIKVNTVDEITTYYVESRSSITHDRAFSLGLEGFDIIGPYSSIAKNGEKMNDFYVRPLYEYLDYILLKYDPLRFEELLRAGRVHLYIVAGTTKEGMIKRGYDKSMGQGATQYRVVKILNTDDAQQYHATFANSLKPKTK